MFIFYVFYKIYLQCMLTNRCNKSTTSQCKNIQIDFRCILPLVVLVVTDINVETDKKQNICYFHIDNKAQPMIIN